MAQDSKKSRTRQPRFIARTVIFTIRTYQLFLSPLLGHRCRFYPTCSHYALDAYQHYGCLRATWLVIKRLAKCHPWHSGGIDILKTDTQSCQKTNPNISTSTINKRGIY